MDDNVADSPRVASAVARMRASGERVTTARRAVLRVVDDADRADEHLTAEMIGARVIALAPRVHRATVYRTLTSLTEAGFLSPIHLGGASTIYHLDAPRVRSGPDPDDTASGWEAVEPTTDGDAPRHAHAHVRCVSCGRVVDVPPHAFDSLTASLAGGIGFALDPARAALLGTCHDCLVDTST